MLVVGAKGFAKEVLQVLHQLKKTKNLVFYDDINLDIPDCLFNTFQVLKSEQEVISHFKNVDTNFTIGIGNPFLRKAMYRKFTLLGGIFCSTISKDVQIGSYDVKLGSGCNVLPNVTISNCVKIGKGALIYYNSIITHDVQIGNFVEISPSVTLLGHVKIGDYCQIGTGAIILPNISIGDNVIVGAGAVVTRIIPNNAVIVGIPAKIVRYSV